MSAANPNKCRSGEKIASAIDIPLRRQPKRDYCSLDNEAGRLFLPIIGSRAFAIYASLLQGTYGEPHLSYAASDVGEAAGMSKATVWRELQVLQWLGMVRLNPGGGNSKSRCEFLDLKELAKRLGATERRGASLRLSKETTQALKGAVDQLRKQSQGKQSKGPKNFPHPSAILFLAAAQRDAGVSPEKRERLTRETQMGSHLLRKKKIHQDCLSPTPFHECNPTQPENHSTNDKNPEMLKHVRDCFNGVMDGMRNHLLDPNRLRHTNLANGHEDWKRFTFGSFGVEAVKPRGNGIELTISAYDPAAANEGLRKYHRKWAEQTQRWFGCEIHVVLVSQAKSERRGAG
jgi:hypothetical protein